jgi:hypothetical protein
MMTTPIGPPTLNSHSFFPVSLSNAKNMPVGRSFESTGLPKVLNGYGFPMPAAFWECRKKIGLNTTYMD